jgi:hypothetical protein
MLALPMSRFVVTNIAGNKYDLTISTSIRYYIIDCISIQDLIHLHQHSVPTRTPSHRPAAEDKERDWNPYVVEDPGHA